MASSDCGQIALKRRIVRHAIETDVGYVARYVASSARAESSLTSVMGLCLAPFLALFIHESSRKLNDVYPELPDIGLASDVREVVARSRNALKLFDDTKRGVNGQVDFFRDKVVSVHRDTFIGGVRLRFLRGLAHDLGIFGYEGIPVGNTHSAAFFIGIDSVALLRAPKDPSVIQGLAVAYGKYFGRLGAKLAPDARSFLDYMDAGVMASGDDVRSVRYYASVFNGGRDPDLNALLCVFQSLTNLVAKVLRLDQDPASRQTIVKLQYITTWEVIRSIRQLEASSRYQLSDRSRAAIGRVLALRYVDEMVGDRAAPLRNSLMHYDIDSRISVATWNPDEFLYGLVRGSMGISVDEFVLRLGELMMGLMRELNVWSAPK